MRAMKYAAKNHNARRIAGKPGFTLVELLVVMALTAIIIVLVFRPLIDSFNLASRASTQVESQTAARQMMREITAAISNADYIYDNTRPNAAINIWLSDGSGNPIVNQLQFGLVDFIAPGHPSDQTAKPTGPVDPTTGQPILTPTSSAGQQAVSLPLAPGRLIQRYFVGLRDNTSGGDGHSVNAPGNTVPAQSGMPTTQGNGSDFHGYANRWSDPHVNGEPRIDNRYTLYTATFLAYIQDPSNPTTYIPNLKLFHTGTNPNDPTSKTDSKLDMPIIEDPNFFYDDGLAGDATSKGNKQWAVPGWKDEAPDHLVHYWENWRAVATSILELYKADTIGLDRDDKGNIIYDVNNRPTIRPLITFSPTYIENEAGSPASMSAAGSEVSYVAAPTFTSQHGAWTTPFRVLVYQNNVVPYASPPTVTGNDPITQAQNSATATFYEYDIDPITGITTINYHDGPNLISNIGPNVNATTGYFTNLNPQYAFTVDPQRGVINFAFPQWVYTLKDANGNPIRQQYNPVDINNGINPGQAYGRRFLSLDDQGTNTPPEQMPAPSVSPLSALFLNPVTNNPTTTPQRVHVVPGSEVVFGPDQRPGSHYGWSIQYTRVASAAGTIGRNEYKINYDPIPNSTVVNDPNDPRARTGYIEFDSSPDTGDTPNLPEPPAVDGNGNPYEDPDNGKYRANSLPLVKAGTSNQGGSLPGGYLASDPVLVQYNFQMNRANDVVKIDYLTRELMTIAINSRLYDPSSASPQDTVLTSQIKSRNLQR
jgi:prepilin-type N-terminal cleavage/methylation domain-containing protein